MQTLPTAKPTVAISDPEIAALDAFAAWLLSSDTPRQVPELIAAHVALSLYRGMIQLTPDAERHLAGIVGSVLQALEQTQADTQAAGKEAG